MCLSVKEKKKVVQDLITWGALDQDIDINFTEKYTKLFLEVARGYWNVTEEVEIHGIMDHDKKRRVLKHFFNRVNTE